MHLDVVVLEKRDKKLLKRLELEKVLYSYLNKKINRNVFNDKFTFEDFVNTSYLSFLAGGQVAAIGTGGLNTNTQQQVGRFI